MLETQDVDGREEAKRRINRTSRATHGGPHMTHRHKLTHSHSDCGALRRPRPTSRPRPPATHASRKANRLAWVEGECRAMTIEPGSTTHHEFHLFSGHYICCFSELLTLTPRKKQQQQSVVVCSHS
jgi:hypothetical protein